MKRHPQTIRSVSANAGVIAWYKRRLRKELAEMHHSVCYWLEAVYKARESEIVGDASPTVSLLERFREVSRRWLRRWNLLAGWLAKSAIGKAKSTTDVSLKNAFRAAGFTVKFQASRELNTVSRALIAENVNLIKKIPQQYLSDVEGIVLRGVSMGRNLKYIREELDKRYDITTKRANLIARDQLDKATQAIQRTRDKEIGITEGIWVHMPGQKTSRETHIAMNGKQFKLEGDDKGLFDPDPRVARKVLPGELVACYPEGSKLYGLPFTEKLYRRWYTGKLSQIVTDNGTVFSVTPNHPILTDSGWKAAGLLNNGDHIIQTRCDGFPWAELDANGMIPTFDELFETFILLGITPTVFNGSAGDFHGDGTNGDVDIIDVGGLLAGVSNTKLIKSLCDLGFSVSEVREIAALFSVQGPRKSHFASDSAFISFVRRCRERLPIFFSRASIAEQIGLALIADGNATSDKPLADNITFNSETLGNLIFTYARLIKGNDLFFRQGIFERLLASMGDFDASLPNVTSQGANVDPKRLCQVFEKNSLGHHFARVIVNSLVDFSGHVYNLQTSLGWYIAEKTVSCNCRCVYRAVLPDIPLLNMKEKDQ